MAVAKKKAAPKKAAAKKPVSALLKKPKATDRGYTKSQLAAHLAEAVGTATGTEISKKQAAAFVDEFAKLLILYAPVGATIPGIGKLRLKKTPRRPARMGRNPATGEEIQIAAKPAGKKLAFSISKAAKVAAGIA